MSAFKDLAGQRFGRLVVIYSIKKRIGGHVAWLCRCDCGNLTEVQSCHLISGRTKSCGCLWKEKSINGELNFKHGERLKKRRPRLYILWESMKARCLNKNSSAYKWYGGRGISVCDEWRNNYPAFKFWAILNGYQDNLTIDRINNNGNYIPKNCQWITGSENSKKSNIDRKKSVDCNM